MDRFVNALNAHLPIFNSRFRVPGTQAFNAFTVSWTAENNWLVLPVHCIVRMIQHLVCSAFGTLVVPYWPSNAFWSFLFASSLDSQPCYKDSLIGSDKFNSAVRIDARNHGV